MVDELGRSELYTPLLPLGVKGRETEGAGVESGRGQGGDDKAYHGDGVAVLLLTAHCCLLSFSFSTCSDAQTGTETRSSSNTRLTDPSLLWNRAAALRQHKESAS